MTTHHKLRIFAVSAMITLGLIGGGCARQTFQDLQPPEADRSLISALIPDRDATEVTLKTTVQILFAKGMDPTTINNTSFFIQDASGNPVTGIASYLNGTRTAQFVSTGGFSYLTTYTATLTTAVTDSQGNALTAPIAWNFTTENVPITFDPNIRVSDDTPATVPAASFSSGQCSLLQSGGVLYAVWYDNRINPSASHIYFSKSTDGGATFGPNVKVDDDLTPTNHEYPCLALDPQGNIDVVWDDYRDGTNSGYDVYFSKSTNGGASFGPNVKINHDGTKYDQTTSSIAVGSDGTIYVTWRDYRNQVPDSHGQPTNADIFISASTDGGLSFLSEVRVDDDTGKADQNHPSIGVDAAGTVAVAWTDQRNLAVNGTNGDIYFATGSLSGSTLVFSPNIMINDDTVFANQHDPSLRIGPAGEILIVWADHRNGGNSNIYFSKSVDGGVTFSPNLAVSPVFVGGQDVPSLAVNASGKIVVTWQDSQLTVTGTNLEILAATSTNDGDSFHTPVLVNDDTNSAAQRQSNVAMDDNGRVYVLWSDNRGGAGSNINFDIYFSGGQ